MDKRRHCIFSLVTFAPSRILGKRVNSSVACADANRMRWCIDSGPGEMASRKAGSSAMRIPAALVLGGLCALGAGCSSLVSARRPASSEQAAAVLPAPAMDSKRADKLADTAWAQWAEANCENTYSADYVAGFKKGFTDYLEAKSEGEPPTVPPASYGPGPYESPQRRQAVVDWSRGFREGATQAHGTGLRPDPTLATHPDALSPAQPIVRRVHEVTPAEILTLPVVMITTTGIAWGAHEELPNTGNHDPL
jgi:hypothetical protein